MTQAKAARYSISKKPVKRSAVGTVAIFLMLGVMGIFIALPFIYAIVQSFKPMSEIFVFPPRFFVRDPTIDNYRILGQLALNSWVPLSRYIFNSVFVSVVATTAHVILASMAAFPLAKFRFPGSAFISSMVVLALLFTAEVTAIPQFVLMSRIGMMNTYWALILPPIASSLGLFLMKQFMSQIHDSLIEAATIDGASLMRTFWRVVMPAVKPAWLTLVIFSFQSVWNREGVEFIYSEQLKMLPTMLRQITASGIARVGAASAAAVLLLIPPIVVFLFSQSNVIETMSSAGIKE